MFRAGVMESPDRIMSTCPASSAGRSPANGMETRRSLTFMASAMPRARSISNPMISPFRVVMFSGGMLAAVPTTSSPRAWIRLSPGEEGGG